MLLVDHIAVEKRDADVDVQGAQRAHDDAAGIAAEAERPGGAPARRRTELAVDEVAHLDRVIDALRDNAASEAGHATDHWACRGVSRAHHVDDAQKACHLVGLSAEAQCGLPGHSRLLHNAASQQAEMRDL